MRRIGLFLLLAIGLLFNFNCSGAKSDSNPAAPAGNSPTATATGVSSSTPTSTPSFTPTVMLTVVTTPVTTYPSPTPYFQSGGDGINGDFTSPYGVASDNVYIAVSDPGFGNIQVFDRYGAYIYEIDSSNSGSSGLNGAAPSTPYGMAFDGHHNLYVADPGTAEVDIYALTPTAGATWIGYYVGGGAISGPMDVKFDNGGNLVVADYGSGLTYNVDFANDTVISSSSGDGGGLFPVGVAVDSSGNIYVADQSFNYIFAYDSGLNCRYAFNGLEPPWPSSLGIPQGIMVDKEGYLLIADNFNGQVVRTSIYGLYNQNVGSGEIAIPEYMSSSPWGFIYVIDNGLDEMFKFLAQ
jgi:hypothetical protein